MATVLYPGSFDPFHNGHRELVETAAYLFDKVVIAAIRNPQKDAGLFSLEERKEMIAESTAHLNNVSIEVFSALVVDLARQVGADVLVKGLRAASDFESELQQAQMNHAMSGIDTLFVPCTNSYSFVASKFVRDFARYGGADRIGELVPPAVAKRLAEKFGTP